MLVRLPSRAMLAACLSSALMACPSAPSPTADNTKVDSTAANEPSAENSADETPRAPAGLGEHIEAEAAGPLTAEEERLLAADPETLSKEERRKRAYAHRKKIMQNPNSPQAQAILQGGEALRRGETPPPMPADGPTSSDDFDPKKSGLTLQPTPQKAPEEK